MDDDDLAAIIAAKNDVSAAITANEGDPWPFNVWQAWQKLEEAIREAEFRSDNHRYERMNEYPR